MKKTFQVKLEGIVASLCSYCSYSTCSTINMHVPLRLDLRLPVHVLDKLSQRLLVGGQEVAVAADGSWLLLVRWTFRRQNHARIALSWTRRTSHAPHPIRAQESQSTSSHIYVAPEAARFLRSTVMGVGERNTRAKVVVYKRKRDEYEMGEKWKLTLVVVTSLFWTTWSERTYEIAC